MSDPDHPRSHPYADVVQALAKIIAARGADRFLGPRLDLILPTERLFPVPWERSLLGVGHLVHQLLHYAGLGDWGFAIEDARVPLDPQAELDLLPGVHFVDIVDDRLIFSVTNLGAGLDVLAAAAHEVALASVFIERANINPYRAVAPEADGETGFEITDRDALEAQAAMVYLGFSVIGLIDARALLSGEASYMLAVQITAIAAEQARDALAELTRPLAPVHAQDVETWVDQLAGEASSIREQLGLPAAEDWPAQRQWNLAPKLDAELELALIAAEEAYQQPKRGVTVPRYTETKTLIYVIIGVVISVVPFFVFFAIEQLRWLCWLPVLGFGAIGAALGSRRLLEQCGGCSMILNADDTTCRKCGATLGDRVQLSVGNDNDDNDDDDDDDPNASHSRDLDRAPGPDERRRLPR